MLTEFHGFDGPLGRLAARAYGLARQMDRRRRAAGTPVRPPVPTISIGNITVGGSGKTPLAGWIAEQALTWGCRPVILSRGYRGSEIGPARVPDHGDPRRWGDEPVMLARRGLTVWVAKQREAAVAAACADGDLLLLDDGFQRVEIARDLDLVTIGPRGFGNGHLLPAGILRDPLQELARADAFCGNVAALGNFCAEIPRFACGVRGLQWTPRAPKAGERVGALAAIASPSAFFEALRQAGVNPEETLGLPDHDPLAKARIAPRFEAWSRAGLRAVIVTEKDAVKLPPQLGGLEILTARADWGPTDPERADALERFLRTRLQL